MTMRPDNGGGWPPELPTWAVLAATWLLVFTAVYAALWTYF